MHHKPFLWLHIKKAGGESFRETLSPYYVQTERQKNYKTFIALPKEQWNDVLNNFKIPLGEYDYKRMLFAQKFLYTKEEFDTMFKFAIVRNPYDRAVSAWKYLTQKPISLREKLLEPHKAKEKKDFAYFLHTLENNWATKYNRHKATHTSSMWADLTNWEGELLADQIFKLENIQHDIKVICKQINIDPKKFVHTNKSIRYIEYRKYYNKECKKLVEKLYADDIHHFNYSF